MKKKMNATVTMVLVVGTLILLVALPFVVYGQPFWTFLHALVNGDAAKLQAPASSAVTEPEEGEPPLTFDIPIVLEEKDGHVTATLEQSHLTSAVNATMALQEQGHDLPALQLREEPTQPMTSFSITFPTVDLLAYAQQDDAAMTIHLGDYAFFLDEEALHALASTDKRITIAFTPHADQAEVFSLSFLDSVGQEIPSFGKPLTVCLPAAVTTTSGSYVTVYDRLAEGQLVALQTDYPEVGLVSFDVSGSMEGVIVIDSAQPTITLTSQQPPLAATTTEQQLDFMSFVLFGFLLGSGILGYVVFSGDKK